MGRQDLAGEGDLITLGERGIPVITGGQISPVFRDEEVLGGYK